MATGSKKNFSTRKRSLVLWRVPVSAIFHPFPVTHNLYSNILKQFIIFKYNIIDIKLEHKTLKYNMYLIRKGRNIIEKHVARNVCLSAGGLMDDTK